MTERIDYNKLIEDIRKKKEERGESIEDTCDEEQLEVVTTIPHGGELEKRGILFVSGPISQDLTNYIIYNLLELHFNTEFIDDIQLIINSPGGSASAGWALIDIMKFVKNKITTIALGELASMAAYIFIAGDKRIIAPHTNIMFHNFSTEKQGAYHELVASRKAEDVEHKKFAEHIIKYSKYKTIKQVTQSLLKEHDVWLTPEEMIKHGLADEIFKPAKK